MKKLLTILSAITLSISISAEEVSEVKILEGECVLIKEDKLSEYLPKESVEEFLSQPFLEEIIHQNKVYKLEELKQTKRKRKKTYKVCLEKINKLK